jgi:hypothetical protein
LGGWRHQQRPVQALQVRLVCEKGLLLSPAAERHPEGDIAISSEGGDITTSPSKWNTVRIDALGFQFGDGGCLPDVSRRSPTLGGPLQN